MKLACGSPGRAIRIHHTLLYTYPRHSSCSTYGESRLCRSGSFLWSFRASDPRGLLPPCMQICAPLSLPPSPLSPLHHHPLPSTSHPNSPFRSFPNPGSISVHLVIPPRMPALTTSAANPPRPRTPPPSSPAPPPPPPHPQPPPASARAPNRHRRRPTP